MYIVMHFTPLTRPGTHQVIGTQGTVRALFSSKDKAKNWCLRQCRKHKMAEETYEIIFLPINKVVEQYKIERIGICKWRATIYTNAKSIPGEAQYTPDKLNHVLEGLQKEPEIQLAYDLLNRDPIAMDIASDVTAGMIQRKRKKR